MFDSHAHLCDHKFDEDREAVLRKMKDEGVTGFMEIGVSEETSNDALRLAEAIDGVYAAVGYHPDAASEADPEILKSLLRNPKAYVIGEIGLDYYYEDPPREIQQKAFRMQMQIAEETGYPVIIHDRDAHGDTLQILSEHPSVIGVMHSYSGSTEMAKTLLKMGWYISFSGVVTFKNARQSVEVAAMVPDDRILAETDSPYLTPVPFRGHRNDSGYMKYTIEKLAEIRGTTFEHIERITEENARTLFRLPR